MDTAIGAARWVVGRALSPIANGVLEAWAASSTLGPNIRALKLELLYAQGMLTSAQRRDDDARNPALTELLLELRHLAYAADDVLDELDYFRIQDMLDGTYEAVDDAVEERGHVSGLALHARHTATAVARKMVKEKEGEAKQGRCISSAAVARAVGKCLPCYSSPSVHDDDADDDVGEPKLKFDRVEMSNKMSNIIKQLKPLCAKVATILGLESLGYSNSAKTQGTDSKQRPKTTPEIIEPVLYGRQNQKKDVVEEIVHGKYLANDLTVLPIVGPAGIGKTTFTQHIYNEVKSHFQVSVWICVSQNFNANKLAQEIVNKTLKSSNERENESDQERIEKRIQSKQFLLVLDDMWTYYEDEWKTLLAPFRKAGSKGNMVIVTTRIPKVAEMIELISCSIKLERLQDEDSMELFQSCVGIKTWKDYPDLEDVGTNIVKRLKGFPLAVKTVGRLLRNQLSRGQWTAVLESKEWELQGNEDDIMPALKLSYNYLPFHLQQCFSCCALFPEDYRFTRQELTNLWIGLGLLDAGHQNKIIEDIGLGYLEELVDYGFFERDGEKYDSPYVIHDLLHDLATNISSYESLRINSSYVRSIHIPTSIRHMSVIIDNASVKDRIIFEDHKKDLSTLGKKLKTGNLHTIMIFGEYHGSFYKIFYDILRDAKSLRVIFLSGVSYNVEDLLPNFAKLVHLRYLRIKDSDTGGASLPTNINRFYHLLVLDVQYHNGELGFLRDMGSLLKLRHFLANDASIYSQIFEVGKLKFLKELPSYEVKREEEGFELEQIGQLLELQGSLGIRNLRRVEEIKEANEAKLAHLNHLDGLRLDWGEDICEYPIREGDILESLKPHSNLRELYIVAHGGTTCPKWLGVDLSIRSLESLYLEGVKWNILPLPGKLCMTGVEEGQGCVRSQGFHNLKTLSLVKIRTLKKWCINGTRNLLPHLQSLIVSDCRNLVELPISQSTAYQSEESMTCFPKLHTVRITNCPKLLLLRPIPWAPYLCCVDICGVNSGFEKLYYQKDEQSKSSLYILGKAASDSMFWNVLDFNNLTELQELNIDSCDAGGRELTQVLSHFPKLSNLTIQNCNYVAGLGVVEQRTITTPESSLSPSANKAAKTLTTRPQQQIGEVGEMETAAAAADDGLLLLPSQVKELEIRYCQDLSLDGYRIQGLLSLLSLQIYDFRKLVRSSSSLYPSFPTSLQRLILCNTDGMETLPSPLPNLTCLVIVSCGNLRGGEALWDLLAQGHLIELSVYKTPNFFLGSEHSCSQVDKQEDVHRSWRLQELWTDDFARVLAAPICHLLSSSLTMLAIGNNNEVECFTKEQEKALHILSSIEDLQFLYLEKLQSLPAGLSQITTIKMLHISYCPAITSLGNLPISLQQLEISRCPAIHSLPKDGLPTSLQEIDVSDCGNEKLTRQCRKLQGTIPIVRV